MIKVDHIVIFNFEGAIRGMRSPMQSWDKSDSYIGYDCKNCKRLKADGSCDRNLVECHSHLGLEIGPNDLKLMRNLYKGGPEHRKYLRQITVSMDITAPLYWWKEMDQYRIGVTTDSCSTMHTLLARPFELDDFSFDKLPGYKSEIKQFVPEISEEMVAHEKWVDVDEGYSVSNYGRIRHNFSDHYRIIGGSKHRDGYIFVTLRGKQVPLHRIVALAFHSDKYREGLVVNHIDGNKQNNFSNNLEWVTQSDNVRHSYENNLQPKSTSTYKGKFSEEEREHIKKLWEDGLASMREIARRYNVSHSCISAVIHDKYKYADTVNQYKEIALPWVDTLNELRDAWINEQDERKREVIWYSIIQLLPSSYNQRRTVTMNYENAVNIIRQRSAHKLDEWREFVEVLKDLPYLRQIIGEEE